MNITDLVYLPFDKSWGETAKLILRDFAKARYGARWEKKLDVRVNPDVTEGAAPFAAFIPAGQPKSGPYGGMSLVFFPSAGRPSLVALVVGTNGLAPDEQVLGRPGHARKSTAISRWISQSRQAEFAWAKRDPVRIDQGMPKSVKESLTTHYNPAVDKYEKVIYACVKPWIDRRTGTDRAVWAYADLLAEEHELKPLAVYQSEAGSAREAWMRLVLPGVSQEDVVQLLRDRRFVILEGPPGTGKTRMAEDILQSIFEGRGRTIQFHPGTTYESFIGGLAPDVYADASFGLRFVPKPGHLMEVAAEALADPRRHYLLHIDEINRADLSKILGEAIFLFEPLAKDRRIRLAHDFGAPFHSELHLPANLNVLGTMNSADRSIAILDIAVRRRFAFQTLWPDPLVLEQEAVNPLMKEAFLRLLSLFIEEAAEEAFILMPGHAYFLDGEKNAQRILMAGLKPLLLEYLQQGYLAGFADAVRAYLDWLETQQA